MKIIIIIFLLLVGFILLIRAFENKLVFFPFKYPAGYWHPEAFNLEVEDCFFNTMDGVKLHGWYLKNPGAIATMLWCHGNAGNITDRLDNLARLVKLPLNVMIFDYRGYGKSDGEPNEEGVYLDAEAAYDYLIFLPEVNTDKIVLFGQSLGSAVAVDLATKRKCRALILESAFTSAADMARRMFAFLPVHLIVKSRFDSINKIKKVKVPVLMLHGDRDRTVPFILGKRLFEAANAPKEFYKIKGADHNDTYIVGGEDYFQTLIKFINRVNELR